MTSGQRLKKFIEQVYDSQKIFAEQLGIAPSMLNRYVLDKNMPGGDVLLKFKQTGLSIDWFLDGTGSMIIRDFSLKIDEEDINDQDILPHTRIMKWIRINYGSIENFAVIMNVDYYLLENILENELVPDPGFINVLRMAGCNINWLSTGKGDQYENNHIGIILKMRKENPESSSEEEAQIDIRKVNDFTTNEFFEFIKLAVKAELKQHKEDFNENE
jgi:transcriptional regulator with XRE-family HTH domain